MALDDERIEKIAQAMSQNAKNKRGKTNKHLSSGYTYMGQFISHELVSQTTKQGGDREVTGNMDLESLYGNNRTPTDAKLQTQMFDDKGRFKLRPDVRLDFLRKENGQALIPELRNDGNVLVGQFHLFWMKLHNWLIDNGYAGSGIEARRLVTLTFQLVVLEDYLPHLMDKRAYELIIAKNHDVLVMSQSGNDWQEIFRFVFRFGHSMVRTGYTLCRGDCSFSRFELHQLFMPTRTKREMTDEDYVDWYEFFCFHASEEEYEGAMRIDTGIAKVMTGVPFGQDIAVNIAKHNIQSEINAGLPTGADIASQIRMSLKHRALKNMELLENQHLKQAAFNNVDITINELPIWLYTLLEAEVFHEGKKLGLMASSVVTSVIKHAIQQADISVYKLSDEYDFNNTLCAMGRWGELLSMAHSPDSKWGRLSMQAMLNRLKFTQF